mgnify:CR=1 FL=1
MNKLLLKYIKSYLAEATLPYKADEISAKLQHELSPNIPRDMTDLSDKETIKALMKNIGENTCISFVHAYDENSPSFNINPHARYHTPHGNYAYPLTLKNFRTLYNIKKVGGTDFATDRPFFLLFKIDSPNTLVVNKDGTTNYKDISSSRKFNKKTTKYNNSSIEKDIERVVRSFLYFSSSAFLDIEASDVENKFNKKLFNRALSNLITSLTSTFKQAGSGKFPVGELVKSFSYDLEDCFTNIYYAFDSEITKKRHQELIDGLKSFITKLVIDLSETDVNKYKKLGDFHKLYFSCWFLSLVAQNVTTAVSNGPIFTMFLKEAGIDGIVDFGSSTLHHAEPEQAVMLNFGNVKGKDIEFIGTFNNVFRDLDKDRFEELAAEIYKTEGFKFSTDIFSPQTKEEKDAFSNEKWFDSSFLHETIENKAYDLGAEIEIKEVEFEGNFITISMSHFINTQTDTKSLLIYDIIKHLLSQHYKGKSVVIYLDFDSLTQGNLTSIVEKIMLNSSFKSLLTHESISTVDISIIGSNSHINISEKLITFLGKVYGKLDLIGPFVNIINNAGSQNFKIYIKDLASLKHFNKLIQSASKNVIIDISEPDLKDSKFSEKDIKEFVSKNSFDNMYSATIKTK